MNYVQHYEINGISTKQIACIELHGEPNAATEGAVGVLAMDVDSPNHDLYKCVGANNGIYTWELHSGDSGEGGDTTELEQRVSEIERDHADNTNFVLHMTALAENPENEGKYFGVKDEMISVLDAPTGGGANIITADSVDELPDPSTVPEGSIGLVPSSDELTLTSPNGTVYSLIVSDDGTLSTEIVE